MFTEHFRKLFLLGAQGNGHYVHTGREDVCDFDVVELEHAVDELGVLLLDAAAAFRFVDHGQELAFGDLLGRLDAEEFRDERLPPAEQLVEGVEQPHQGPQDGSHSHAELFRHLFGDGLRGDFRENEDDDLHDDGRPCVADVAHRPHEKNGGNGRSADVDDVVADEDGRQHGIVVIDDFQSTGGRFSAFLLHGFQPDLVGAGKRGLRGREEPG